MRQIAHLTVGSSISHRHAPKYARCNTYVALSSSAMAQTWSVNPASIALERRNNAPIAIGNDSWQNPNVQQLRDFHVVRCDVPHPLHD